MICTPLCFFLLSSSLPSFISLPLLPFIYLPSSSPSFLPSFLPSPLFSLLFLFFFFFSPQIKFFAIISKVIPKWGQMETTKTDFSSLFPASSCTLFSEISFCCCCFFALLVGQGFECLLLGSISMQYTSCLQQGKVKSQIFWRERLWKSHVTAPRLAAVAGGSIPLIIQQPLWDVPEAPKTGSCCLEASCRCVMIKLMLVLLPTPPTSPGFCFKKG